MSARGSAGIARPLEAAPPRYSSWRAAVVLSLAVAAVYLCLTPWTTLWDRDEARFGRAALEMVETGRYLYPTFAGELRPQKPALVYWLMAMAVWILGPTELALRFWSPVALAVTSILTFAVARRIVSTRAGLLAMGIIAINPLAMMEGLAATTDAILLAALTGAVLALVSMLWSGVDWRRVAGLTVALTLAQFAKGPAAALVFLSSAAGILLLTRAHLRHRRGILGALAGAVTMSTGIYLLWAFRVDAATGGAYLQPSIGREILLRVLTPMEGHGGDLLVFLPFYAGVIALGFLPWAPFLPGGWREIRGRAAAATGPGGAKAGLPFGVLAGWIAGPFALFTMAATKLPHYILPVWPALAIMAAASFDAALDDPRGDRTRPGIVRAFRVLCCALAAAVLGLGVGAVTLGDRRVAAALAVVIAAMVGGLVVTGMRLRRGAVASAVSSLFAGAAAAHIIIGVLVMPAIEPYKASPPIAAAIRRQVSDGVPVATHAYDEPSLDFYLSPRRLVRLPGVADVERWLREPGPGVMVTTGAAWGDLQPAIDAARLKPIARASGFNYSKGDAVELLAFEKGIR
jgi:4-amino-4-deoxy-L-arabinose transferase-like glycosyltransferase